jgi:hypothetical protein
MTLSDQAEMVNPGTSLTSVLSTDNRALPRLAWTNAAT